MLTEPRERVLDWMDDGLCAALTTLAPDDFFYEHRFRGGQRQANHEARLRAVCNACPVQRECDEFADRTDALWGFWAGVTAEERRKRRCHAGQSSWVS